MIKQIDLSVLPDGFLIEAYNVVSGKWFIIRNHERETYSAVNHKFRPLQGEWLFNDGSMVLPDGLVVEAQLRDDDPITGVTKTQSKGSGVEYEDCVLMTHIEFAFNVEKHFQDIMAVKILGVQEGYECEGLEVVDCE